MPKSRNDGLQCPFATLPLPHGGPHLSFTTARSSPTFTAQRRPKDNGISCRSNCRHAKAHAIATATLGSASFLSNIVSPDGKEWKSCQVATSIQEAKDGKRTPIESHFKR